MPAIRQRRKIERTQTWLRTIRLRRVRNFEKLFRFVVKRLEPADFKPARTGRYSDDDFVACFLAHQASSDGRDSRNQTLRRIALFGRDQTVSDFLIALGVKEHERRTIGGFVARDP